MNTHAAAITHIASRTGLRISAIINYCNTFNIDFEKQPKTATYMSAKQNLKTVLNCVIGIKKLPI